MSMNREERITHDKLLALGFKKVMNTECYYLGVNDFVSCWKEDDDFYWLKIRIIVPNKPSSSYDALLRFKYVYELQKAFDLYKVINKQD